MCGGAAVLLLKAPSDEYREQFSRRGLHVHFIEPLQTTEVNLEQLRERLARPYRGLVVTSARAVSALRRVWDEGARQDWSPRPVWAVGAATARALVSLGLEARGQSGDAHTLVECICAETAEGDTLLFPAGDLRLDTLEAGLTARGRSVDAVTVYETTAHPQLGAELTRLEALRPSLRAVVYFSPSGVEYVLRVLKERGGASWSVEQFAVGPTTARGLTERGAPLAGIAPAPTAAAVARLVHDHILGDSDKQ